MSWRSERYHVGVDVGGTFTDLVCAGPAGLAAVTKVPSTSPDPTAGVLTGLESLASLVGAADLRAFLGRIDVIVHGTTVATNAILTGNGARTGLITTRGFRDALEMRRGVRARLYDNKSAPPAPLVPRYLRVGVSERLDERGHELAELDEADLRGAIGLLRDEQVEAVAVCFMHAYADGAHEQQARTLIEREWPEVYVCASHELLPERKFYERTSTVAINAFAGPILQNYMASLTAGLEDAGFAGTLRIMKSNGGMMSPEVAAREAAHTMLSGPAGAVAGATYWSGVTGMPDCIVADMGGTSFDVCLIEDGVPLVTRDGSIADHRLMLPLLDIHTVGAGGGSIAGVDAAGLLQVGPASAGSDPGPACYGSGGERPTVTDADVVLGFIDPAYFLGGRMQLDAQAAHDAITAHVAEPLDLPVTAAAAGVYDVINARMAAAIREVSVQRGHDPRRFMLVTAGGASSVHICAIAREIGIRDVLVPRDPGMFSAFGMLTTEFRHDFVRTAPALLAEIDVPAVKAAYIAMQDQGDATLRSEGVASDDIVHEWRMDLRYRGQVHEVDVSLAPEDLDEPGHARLERRFHARHEAIYAHATDRDPVELVNLRLTSIGRTWNVELAGDPLGAPADAQPSGTRDVYVASERDFVEVPVFKDADLVAGNRVRGPAIVERTDTSIVVTEFYDAVRDAYGNYRLAARAAAV